MVFVRFSVPMFPEATLCFIPFIYTLCVIAIIYTSLTTIRQINLKKIIAYEAHMNFVTIGMFSLNIQGFEVIWMGVYPKVFLEYMHTFICNVVQYGKFD
uniref:NADH-ubiquinone oxidoreductase chain 4 n=1 Tax=Physcomitrium patens TaxID=3218 RepID=A0A7I4E0U7_PHYPA